MSPAKPHGVAALERGLELFSRIVDDGGNTPLSALAQVETIPLSTAQRMVATFVRHGLLSRVERGRYAAGLRLAAMAGAGDSRSVLIAASRPLLHRLSRAIGMTVHLGVLEGDMVTYLVKEHGGGPPVLTREMIQLEAYCSGVGKVLLAHLEEAAQAAYLAAGPFVALTAATIIEPSALAAAFRQIRDQGYGVDNAEVEDNLYCVAVPLRGPGGEVLAAISASNPAEHSFDAAVIRQLQACAAQIERRLGRPSEWTAGSTGAAPDAKRRK